MHLRYVYSFLQDAARKVPPELGIDFEGVLQKIRSVASEVPSRVIGNESGQVPVFKDVMDIEYAASPATHASSISGDVSQQSFILRVIQLMVRDIGNSQNESRAVAALFDADLPDMPDQAPAPLPPQGRAMLLIDGLFNSQQPMLAFLHEPYFRDMVDLVYQADSPDDGIDRFIPLLHFVLALGHLSAEQEHATHACNHPHHEAIRHYHAGQELLQQLEMNNLIALQTVLCAAVFLISTCRLATARPLIGLASSLVLQLGLHETSVDLPTEWHKIRAGIFLAVLHLDMYASVILGMPSFLQPQDLDLTLIDNLASESSQQDDWHTVTSVAQFRLLLICKSNEDSVIASGITGKDKSRHTVVDEACARLRGWMDRVGWLLKALQDQPASAG